MEGEISVFRNIAERWAVIRFCIDKRKVYSRMPLDAVTTQFSYADDRTPIVEAFASG